VKVRLTILSLLVAQLFRLEAQRSEAGVWLSLQMPVNLGKNWQWHNDAGYRTAGVSVRPSQYLYRSGIRYRLNRDYSVAAGIAGFFTKSLEPADEGQFGKEFRCWQELNCSFESNQRFHWQLRGRIEQRFFAKTISKGSAYANRFRLRAGISSIINRSWSVQIADEWMEQQRSGKLAYDQNRVMLHFIRKGKGQSQWSAGYMWLKWKNESQHIIAVTYQKIISINGH
jgi:hypothetical protein